MICSPLTPPLLLRPSQARKVKYLHEQKSGVDGGAKSWHGGRRTPFCKKERQLKTPDQSPQHSPGLRLAVDLGPLVIFFGVYFLSDIFVATGVYMVVAVTALSYAYFREGRVAPMPIITTVIVVVFGGLAIGLENKQFIFMKPTIINVLFATILTGGLLTGRPFMKLLFQEAFDLTPEGWTKLTLRWIGFFCVLAIVNEAVWRNFSEAFWVSFKLFGVLPLSILFTVAQMPFLMKHQRPDADSEETGLAMAEPTKTSTKIKTDIEPGSGPES